MGKHERLYEQRRTRQHQKRHEKTKEREKAKKQAKQDEIEGLKELAKERLILQQISARTQGAVFKRARLEGKATIELHCETRDNGCQHPKLHVLTDDGRIAEFTSQAIVIPESTEDGKAVPCQNQADTNDLIA